MHLLSDLMKGKYVALKRNSCRQERDAEIVKSSVIHLLLSILLE